jgi:hypothetical protein
MSLILVFNKNSPRAHTALELGVLGVHRKFTCLKEKIEKNKKFFTQATQTAID